MTEDRLVIGATGRRILGHWKEHRPKMYRALKKSGHLDKVALNAQERHLDLKMEALDQGLAPDQADEIARQVWMFPTEEDQPNLLLPTT